MKPDAELANLQAARVGADLTRWDVSQRLGISPQKLARIEGGERKPEAGFATDYRRVLLELDEERRTQLLARVGADVAS